MSEKHPFEMGEFLPYLLAQAAEECSLAFSRHYKSRYGMLRTEWRVLFHLGRYGEMTAREICDRAKLHKTKVSRAVVKLEEKRFLRRETDPNDRRSEILHLTLRGSAAYVDLAQFAEKYERSLLATLPAPDREVFRRCLIHFARLPEGA